MFNLTRYIHTIVTDSKLYLINGWLQSIINFTSSVRTYHNGLINDISIYYKIQHYAGPQLIDTIAIYYDSNRRYYSVSFHIDGELEVVCIHDIHGKKKEYRWYEDGEFYDMYSD